jgi:hypothetical protein
MPEQDHLAQTFGLGVSYRTLVTHSLADVAQALKQENVEVYKFGELTRIMEVEVTYQEKPMELT